MTSGRCTQKVILAGPFSFRDFANGKASIYKLPLPENRTILSTRQKFDTEYQKYTSAVDTLGERIASTGRQFDVVANTRNRQLTSVVDKIKNQNILEEKNKGLID